MVQEKNYCYGTTRRRKSLTEEQERVVDRMLSGMSLEEAAATEGVDQDEVLRWKQLGTAFEEIQREMLMARWESCRLTPMYLIRLSQARLARIIESGKDAEAIKATGLVIKYAKLLAPNGYHFKLSSSDSSLQYSMKDISGDYWEDVEPERRPEAFRQDRKRAGGRRSCGGSI